MDILKKLLSQPTIPPTTDRAELWYTALITIIRIFPASVPPCSIVLSDTFHIWILVQYNR